MKLEIPLKTLFDCPITQLAAETISAGDEIWEVDQNRSRQYGVHRQTRSIRFKWLENDWQPGAPMLIQDFHYAPPGLTRETIAVGAQIAAFYGGRIVKLMLARLPAGARIEPHCDRGAALELAHRCHVPVLTNAAVDFFIDHLPLRLQAGKAYEIDNTRTHAVVNRGVEPRVHLICDIMPG